MTEVQHMKLIQILVTNRCENQCCHCSQMCPCRPEKFDMSLIDIEIALKSLQNYPGHIGIMGGNPLLHPYFPEVLELLRKYVPVKARRELWCSKQNFARYKNIIDETFYPELVAYNEHEDAQPCWHQPTNIAIDEVFDNKNLMWKIIDNCWVQNRWSAMVTPDGAYFCEVAAARAHMMSCNEGHLIEGLTIEKDWWKEPLTNDFYVEQRKKLCTRCSMCLPMPQIPNDSQKHDDVSSGMKQIMDRAGNKWPVEVYNVKKLRAWYEKQDFKFRPETSYEKRGGFSDIPDWHPWIYRPLEEKKHAPKDVGRRATAVILDEVANDSQIQKFLEKQNEKDKV